MKGVTGWGEWHESLAVEVRSRLLDDVWRLVDDYRDRIWACVAPAQFENRRDLLLFFTALERVADGAIVVLARRAVFESGEDATPVAAAKQKVGEAPRPSRRDQPFGVNEMWTLGLEAGFAVDRLVVIERDASAYDERMNAALDLVGGRCRYILELQTSERPTLPPSDDPAVGDRKPLLEALTVPRGSGVATWFAGTRHLFHLAHHAAGRRWRCLGAAHSWIEDDNARSILVGRVPMDAFGVSFQQRSHRQYLANYLALVGDVERGAATSSQSGQSACRRARFYLGEVSWLLGDYSWARFWYQETRCKFMRGAGGYAQEAYIACERLSTPTPGATAPHTDDVDARVLLILDASVADPCRYEVMIAVLRTACDDATQAETVAQRENATYQLLRVLAATRDRITLHDLDDPVKARVDFAPHRQPKPISDRLFPRTSVSEETWILRYRLGIAAAIIRDHRLAYAAWNTLLLDPLFVGRRDVAERCRRQLAHAYPSHTTPIPHLIAALT